MNTSLFSSLSGFEELNDIDIAVDKAEDEVVCCCRTVIVDWIEAAVDGLVVVCCRAGWVVFPTSVKSERLS